MFFYLLIEATVSTPSTPQKSNFGAVSKTAQINAPTISNATNPKRQAAKVQSTASISLFNRSDVIPVIVPRNNPRTEQAAESRKEDAPVKAVPLHLQSKTSDVRKIINSRDDFERANFSSQSDNEPPKSMDLNVSDRSFSASVKSSISGLAADRKARDDKPMLSRRVDTNAAIDSLARYQHESCMCPFSKCKSLHFVSYLLAFGYLLQCCVIANHFWSRSSSCSYNFGAPL